MTRRWINVSHNRSECFEDVGPLHPLKVTSMNIDKFPDRSPSHMSRNSFDSNAWIGKSICYPTVNIPRPVILERRRLLKLPPFFSAAIPSRTTPVRDLVEMTTLPSVDPSLALDVHSFSSSPPNLTDAHIDFLFHCPLPSLSLILALLDTFGPINSRPCMRGCSTAAVDADLLAPHGYCAPWQGSLARRKELGPQLQVGVGGRGTVCAQHPCRL